MTIGFSSAARNLFLLGSSGEQVVTNFFKTIDQSAGTDGVYLPDEIKYNFVDQKFVLAGSAADSNSKEFGWFEKRDQAGSAEWDVRVEATSAGVNTTLRAMELDSNDNLIVVGKTGDVPWIAKYSNGGVIDWQSTTNSGDVEYTGITSDSNGNYYACGSTPYSTFFNTVDNDSVAFVEKFDSNGNPGWGKAATMLGRDVVLSKIAANDRGEVVAVGYIEDDTGNKGYIVKIDTNTGEVLWDRTLQNRTEEPFFPGVFVKSSPCNDVYIDSKDQIYIIGSFGYFGDVFSNYGSYLIKYSPEGNIIWQRETPFSDQQINGESIHHQQVKSDGETEQTVVLSRYFSDDNTNGDGALLLSKYSKDGSLVWRRTLRVNDGWMNFKVNLDADPSFYYVLFADDFTDGFSGTPDRYTFGKVSSSGNGLGAFEYTDGGYGLTFDYLPNPITDKIGRFSDGSVRNDTSDFITYPFNANKILFDDLATQVSNKKRQMDDADSFEYSGSPAIRPVDFPNLSLDISNFNRRTVVVEDSNNNIGAELSTFGPFSGTSSIKLSGGTVEAYWNNPTVAPGTGPYTLEAFIYVNAYPTSGYVDVMALGHQFPNPYDTLVMNSAGTLFFSPSNGVLVSNPNTIPLNQWVHLAITRNGNLRSVYINGVAMLSGYAGGSSASLNFVSVRLGDFWGSYGPLDGYASNVRLIYQELYTSNFTPPSTAFTYTGNEALLFAHKKYWFDEFKLNDESVEGIITSSLGQVQVSSAAGVVNPLPVAPTNSFYFNGNGTYLSVPYKSDWNLPGDFTLEAWINRKTAFNANWWQDAIMGHDDGSGNNNKWIFSHNGTSLFFHTNDTVGGAQNIQAPTGWIPTNGEWYNVVITRSGNTYTFYQNSTSLGTVTNSAAIPVASAPLKIGNAEGGGLFNGYIGDLRIYSRALTAGQVFQNYNASKAKYIGEQAETAPKIGPGIVYDSNLLLNYDFGNKATYPSKNFVRTLVTSPTSGNGSEFGMKATSFGNDVVVGEPWRDDGYIYICGSNGSIKTTIAAPDPDSYGGSEFGFRFDADPISNRIVAQVNNFSNNGGRIRVLNGSTGALVTTITHPSPFDGTTAPTWSSIADYGLAIGGGKIAASNINYYKSGTTTQAGQVWIWNIDGTNQIAIPNPDPDNFNQFGYKINIADSKIAISAFRNFGSTATRKVWIYDLSGNLVRTLEPPVNDTTLANNWGGSGCFLGDNRYAVVDDDNAEGGYNSGAVYLYDYDGNFIKKLRAAETNFGTTRRFFGYTGQQDNVGITIKNQKIYVAYGSRNTGIQPAGINIYDIDGNFEKKLHGLTRDWNSAGFTVLNNDTIVVSDTSTNGYDGGMYIYSLNNVKNLSSTSYTGTVGSATTFNSAGYFEFVSDTNSQIQTPTGLLQFGNSFTVEQWIYHSTSNSSTGNPFGYGKSPDVPANYAFVVHSSGPTGYYAFISDGSGTSASSPNPSVSGLSNNTWYHITWVVSGTNITAYLNGSLSNSENTGLASVNIQSDQYAVIGRDVRYVGTSSRHMTGGVGQTRLYNRALSPTEVSQNFNATRSKYGV